MLLYFEFEEKRRKAEVVWPKSAGNIVVQLGEKDLVKDFPTDLYFEVKRGNKVTFIIEDSSNKRLTELQSVISRRLQELVNQ